jgi:serine/threonine-protein kinase
VLVGLDGIGRVIDFGIAKAAARRATTEEGRMKGKLAYMSPEQLIEDAPVDARSDVFAAGVLLWTVLTGKRLFQADSEGATVRNIITKEVLLPSRVGLRPPKCFDAVCLRALDRNPDRRFQSAEEMAEALRTVSERQGLRAPRAEIARWVKKTFQKEFAARRQAIREHIHAPPGRPSFASVDDVEALPGLTAPTIDASDVSDRMLVPVPEPRRRRRGAILAVLLCLGVGAAAGVWYLRFRDMPLPFGDSASPAADDPGAPATTSVPIEPDPPSASVSTSAPPPAPSAAPHQTAPRSHRPPVVAPAPRPSKGPDVGY